MQNATQDIWYLYSKSIFATHFNESNCDVNYIELA